MPITSSDPTAGPALRVSPTCLRGTGEEFRRVGHDLVRGARQAAPVTTAADAGCPGWAAGTAAVAAAYGWQEHLTDLAGQVEELGRAFGAAADAYRTCDERAAARAAGAVPW